MQTTLAIILAFASFFSLLDNCLAEDVTATKTFEYGDIVEYDLLANLSDPPIKIRCTINKKTEKTHIRYGGENRLHNFSSLKPILIKLLGKADNLSKGRLHSLLAFEFLNCDDIGKKGVIAFQDHQQWQKYLSESKRQYVKPPNDFVKRTLIQKKVYKALHEAVRHTGYNLELVSVEKIFKFRAEQLSFYAELKTVGIAPDQVFPVPGILGFRISKKE